MLAHGSRLLNGNSRSLVGLRLLRDGLTCVPGRVPAPGHTSRGRGRAGRSDGAADRGRVRP